ncbi:olfactory receptor 1E16-like [Aquarana catesbeiana]|uniref:olfactory receptor 1E16-like n=1 Tax=Aquarana catesbeiana TaxID=8400 RepID=UPI003CC9AF85
MESGFQQFSGTQNKSSVSKVFIVGFKIPFNYRLLLFNVFLIIYILTLACNLLIILLMLFSELSSSPMYVFLSNLSLSEVLFTSSIAPPMLHVIHRDGATFPLVGCFIQFFLCGSFAGTESFLLSVMSYDRFLAICKPLNYRLIMNPRLCLSLILVCWTSAFLIISISLTFLKTLNFCSSNIIDHFFCDFSPLLKLSCSDTSIVEMVVSLLSSSATMLPFLTIVASYGFIIQAITRISSAKGKKKAFSTCSSHLGVVSTFYATMIMAYVVPPGHLLVANKVLSLLYTVITPLLNPFIYTLRNEEIKAAIKQTLTFIRRI